MLVAVLTACLAAAPQTCAARMLPATAAADEAACRAAAGAAVPAWLARHPGLTGAGWTCAPLPALPALRADEVAPGVHVHRGETGPLSPGNGGGIANLSFVIGTDRVGVIDPGGSRAEGEALFAAIRRLTDLPIGPVILTHMHPDHIAGAEPLAEAGGEIVADARLPPALAARRESWMQSIPAQTGDAAWLGTVLIDPARTIEAPETISLGGTSLTLTPERTAHTDTDLTVRDARSGTLFTGDLVFRGLTPVVDGSLRGWLAWLAAPAPEAPVVVPGHGPLAASLAGASAPERAYLSALADAVRASLDAGDGLSQAVPAVVAAMAPQAPGWADFPATTARNAAAAFAEMEWD